LQGLDRPLRIARERLESLCGEQEVGQRRTRLLQALASEPPDHRPPVPRGLGSAEQEADAESVVEHDLGGAQRRLPRMSVRLPVSRARLNLA
jgi:hypothetical protein